jgi:hypothetical protein
MTVLAHGKYPPSVAEFAKFFSMAPDGVALIATLSVPQQ